MNPKTITPRRVEIRETRSNQTTLMPEVLSYFGVILALGGVSLIIYQKWDEITQSQKTAIFSLMAIAFFVAGLLAGDTENLRRRVSGFLYVLAAAASGLAVYVTFPSDIAPFRSFALAAVVSLFGYTISQTSFGHIALFASTSGALITLIIENVETRDLRIYTGISVGVAFSMLWVLLAAVDSVERDLGLALGTWGFFMAAQVAFASEFQMLSYSITLALIALCLWLYAKEPSWVLVTAGMLSFVISLGEFVIETLDGSIAAAIGLLIIGAITATLSVQVVNRRRSNF